MSNGFDAYHKWLSIPPHEQPPNHYRLLGLELFESDPDVVSAAADRQMAHVQTYKTGPHSALSQQLLNEIAIAKLCLLRPQKKAAYDLQLRQQQPAAPVLPTVAAPARAPQPANSGTSRAPPPPTIPPPATLTAPPVHSQAIATSMLLLVASAVMAVLLVVGIVVLLAHRGPRSPAEPTLGPASTQSSNGVAQNETKKADVAPIPSVPKAVVVAVPKSAASAKSPASMKPPSQPTAQPPAKVDDKLAATLSANSGPKQASTAVGIPPGGSASATPAAGVSLAGKMAVPDQATLDALAPQIPSAPDAKPADILDQARKLTAAPQMYLLLRRSVDRAVEQGDAATAIAAAAELVRRFALDSAQLRQTFENLQAHAKTPDSLSALAGAAAATLDDPAIAVQADLVQHLAELSIVAARRSGNLETIRKVTLRILRLHSASPAASSPSTSS